MADDNMVLIQIRGDISDINAKLADLKGKIGGVKDATSDMGKRSGIAFALFTTGINQAIDLLMRLKYQVQEYIDAYASAEQATMKLAVAMRNQGDYSPGNLGGLQDYAKMLQDTTAYEDDFLIARMATMKTYGMTNEEIKKVIPTILDFTTARQDEGMTVDKAADLMGKAYAGQTDKLKRYGIVIDESIPKAERFNEVVKQMQERFGGAASAELETYSGQVKQLKNMIGDIAEEIGKKLIQALRSVQILIDMVGAGYWTMVEKILRGTAWLMQKLDAFAKWAGIKSTGAADLAAILGAGADNAAEASNVAIANASKHTDQLLKLGDIDPAIQKIKPGSRTRWNNDDDTMKKLADDWAKTLAKMRADEEKANEDDPMLKKLIDINKEVDEMTKKFGITFDKEGNFLSEKIMGSWNAIKKWRESQIGEAASEAAKKDLDEEIKLQQGLTEEAKKAAREKKAMREAEIKYQLVDIETAEKYKNIEQADAVREKIRLTKELLEIQGGYLKEINRDKDGVGWRAQMTEIQNTKKTLEDLNNTPITPGQKIALSLRQLSDEAHDVGKQMGEAFTRAFNNLENALTDAVMKGKADFASLRDSIISDMIRIQIRANITGPLSSALGGLFKSAQGNIFENGELKRFAKGTIVWKPLIFPMANGAGLMGEAGPEAVMPLARTPSGDLGVKTTGGGSGLPNFTVNINNIGPTQMQAKSADMEFDFATAVLTIVLDGVSRNKMGLRDTITGN